jgi:adenylosuccinate synthase
MPVTVVVGGQFGSEGKGKVAYFLAQQLGAHIMVRVGGSNSGHTVIADGGERIVLRQLPAAALLENTTSVLGPGSYIDLDVLSHELELVGLPRERLLIDELAVVITAEDREIERRERLGELIGSTQSGTGAAVVKRIARQGQAVLARDVPVLQPMVCNTSEFLRSSLERNARVVIEGTQGFGLSVLHSRDYPFVTSRDTSAAGMVSEAGLSPLDVDEVVMVLRAFPIRVAGNSGPLPREIDWEQLAILGNHDHELKEWTSVTKRERRVAEFDPIVVRDAISVNSPTSLVMNHLDYVDHKCCETGRVTRRIQDFLASVEESIGLPIDWLGLGPSSLVRRRAARRIASLGA